MRVIIDRLTRTINLGDPPKTRNRQGSLRADSMSMFRPVRLGHRTIVSLSFSAALALSLGACGGHATEAPTVPSIPARISIPQSYVGIWYVHLGILTITADGTGSQVFSTRLYGETDTITFVSQDHGRMLLGIIRDIRFADSSGSIANPDPADAQRVGDMFSLAHVGSHILKKTYLKSALPSINQKVDNPNWCGPGLNDVPEDDRQRCGVG